MRMCLYMAVFLIIILPIMVIGIYIAKKDILNFRIQNINNSDRLVDDKEDSNEIIYTPILQYINVEYIAGLKGISKEIKVHCYLMKEGILFTYNKYSIDNKLINIEQLIEWHSIIDVDIQTEKHIQDNVNLGNLVLFGVLAFGMNKQMKVIEKEYIVLSIKNFDNSIYNIILYCDDYIQELYDTIERYINLNPSNDMLKTENNPTKEDDIYIQIKKLGNLKESNLITEEEFIEKKKLLLDKIK